MPNLSGLKLPHFSFRFFVYFLFALVLLALLAEGGYYYFSQRKKEARLQATDWMNLIEGEINKISGRTLMISVKDNIPIPRKVEIEVASDAFIFIPPPRNLIVKLSSVSEEEQMDLATQLDAARQSILFTDLKVGDIIQAGTLTKLTRTKFKAESIAVIKE